VWRAPVNMLVRYVPQRITGFHRIRHYGLLANAARRDNLARARELLAAPLSPLIAVPAVPVAPAEAEGTATRPCPCCGAPMLIVERFTRAHAPRAPPPALRQAASA